MEQLAETRHQDRQVKQGEVIVLVFNLMLIVGVAVVSVAAIHSTRPLQNGNPFGN